MRRVGRRSPAELQVHVHPGLPPPDGPLGWRSSTKPSFAFNMSTIDRSAMPKTEAVGDVVNSMVWSPLWFRSYSKDLEPFGGERDPLSVCLGTLSVKEHWTRIARDVDPRVL